MKKNAGLICYLSLFLIVEFIFGYFILETRSIFLEKTVQTGQYLAQSYVEKIETRLEEYIFSVELAGQYLEEMNDAGADDGALQQWLKSYSVKIEKKFGDNTLDFYTVLDHTLIGANPWAGDDSYDYRSKSWYYEAVRAEAGTIVFSDLYQDAVTGQDVFTISTALTSSENVVALDVYLSNEDWLGFSDLPEDYGIFLYGSQATLAYSMGRSCLMDFPEEEYAALQEDRESDTIHYKKAVGEDYNLYLCALDNGWSVIVAIPSENLVSQEHVFLMDVGLRLNILNVVIVIVFLIKNELSKKKHNLDTLTGLLNKSYFMKCTRKKLKKSDGVLLMIDLDNFKQLNDNYGHDCGDRVLQQVAALLDSCFRKTDYIGRFGGDEFIVYVDAPLSDRVLDAKAQELMEKIGALARQYPRSSLSVSIGGSRCKKGDKYSEVFKRADKSLYSVKGRGKSGYAMYAKTES